MSFNLNENEYGLSQEPLDFQFTPTDYGVIDKYAIVKEIYQLPLSPTIIQLATHKESDTVLPSFLTHLLDCYQKDNLEREANE